MKVYTRSGDDGKTTTYAGKDVPKDHPVIIAGLKLDYVLSALDTIKPVLENEDLEDIFTYVEERLWQSAGEISLGEPGKNVDDPIDNSDIEYLEQLIDDHNPGTDAFVRFSGETSTRINEARVRVRDLEVFLTRFLRDDAIREALYKFINRLSDLLYVLACEEEQELETHGY